MIFEQALEPELNSLINQAQDDIIKSMSAYLIKVMPFRYKDRYALNVMFNSKFTNLRDKQKVLNVIKNIAEKYNGKLKSIEDNDNVLKIFF